MKNTITALLLGIVIGAVLAVTIGPGRDRATQAGIAPELKGEKVATLTCKPVVIYRDKVADKLGVPAKAGQHVTAATKIPADDHPRTVSALYDEQTGETSLFVRRDPLPWFATDSGRVVGLYYGMRDEHGTVARLDLRADFLRVKSARIGVIGSADTSGGWFAGVGVTVGF